MTLRNPPAEPQIPGAIARDTELTAAIAAHEAALNPHNNYLTLGSDSQYVAGIKVFSELRTFGSNNPLRMANSVQTYSTIFRIDNNNFYLLLSNQNDPYGSFNSFRPLTVALGSGAVSIETVLRLPNLPTSPSGLAAGTVWRDGNTLKVV